MTEFSNLAGLFVPIFEEEDKELLIGSFENCGQPVVGFRASSLKRPLGPIIASVLAILNSQQFCCSQPRLASSDDSPDYFAAMSLSNALIAAAQALSQQLAVLPFSAPVAYVYNPLQYAWAAHAQYLQRFANNPKRVIFLGMNPGPFGMAQTGLPFGEVAAVRDWIGIQATINKPHSEHPKRPVKGFVCQRSEVSGRRLWGLFAERFGGPARFFADHFVLNYCPLLFLEASGRNRTPDKLPLAEARPLLAACDTHLAQAVQILQPQWVIGVGAFAAQRAQEVLVGRDIHVGRILHPSPASPAANSGWAAAVTVQLRDLGVWD